MTQVQPADPDQSDQLADPDHIPAEGCGQGWRKPGVGTPLRSRRRLAAQTENVLRPRSKGCRAVRAQVGRGLRTG